MAWLLRPDFGLDCEAALIQLNQNIILLVSGLAAFDQQWEFVQGPKGGTWATRQVSFSRSAINLASISAKSQR
jgi:hypothetical protein